MIFINTTDISQLRMLESFSIATPKCLIKQRHRTMSGLHRQTKTRSRASPVLLSLPGIPFINSTNTATSISEALIVRRVPVVDGRKKLLFDQAWARKAEHGVGGTGLVVRTACSTSAKALLADKGSGGFAV
jgi:hypothetical protein